MACLALRQGCQIPGDTSPERASGFDNPLEVKGNAGVGEVGDRGEAAAAVGQQASHPHGPRLLPSRPALVWVTVLPHVTPVQTEDDQEVMQIIDDLFPIFSELAAAEATALWSPDDLEAAIEEQPPSLADLSAVGATALCRPEVDMTISSPISP
ncbi:hypothetical protein R3I94_018415 [Phoxinus phoxinus]